MQTEAEPGMLMIVTGEMYFLEAKWAQVCRELGLL